MFAFITNWLVLFIVLAIKLNELKHVLADDGPRPPIPTVSTNVSTVAMGSAFAMKCEMPTGYTIGDKEFSITFWYNITGNIARYTIPASNTTGARQQIFKTSLSNNDKLYIASIEQVNRTASSTSNTFEVIITTTKKAYSAQFSCYAWYNNLYSDYSKLVPVIVTDILPTLTTSDSQIHFHQPFTFTCSLPERFNPATTAYQVAFFNSRDDLLAHYEVDASGKVLLVSNDLPNITAHHGPRKAFPTFDLVIVEQADRKLSYWCALVTLNSTTHSQSLNHESLRWNPAVPFVDFNSSSSTDGSEHRARCSISELSNFGETEYKVLFYTSLGPEPKAENLLGYYWVTPHDVGEFITERVAHWTSILHGASVDYPHFEIVGQLKSGTNVTGHQWWCAINRTTGSGQSQERQIKSNLVAF